MKTISDFDNAIHLLEIKLEEANMELSTAKKSDDEYCACCGNIVVDIHDRIESLEYHIENINSDIQKLSKERDNVFIYKPKVENAIKQGQYNKESFFALMHLNGLDTIIDFEKIIGGFTIFGTTTITNNKCVFVFDKTNMVGFFKCIGVVSMGWFGVEKLRDGTDTNDEKYFRNDIDKLKSVELFLEYIKNSKDNILEIDTSDAVTHYIIYGEK